MEQLTLPHADVDFDLRGKELMLAFTLSFRTTRQSWVCAKVQTKGIDGDELYVVTSTCSGQRPGLQGQSSSGPGSNYSVWGGSLVGECYLSVRRRFKEHMVGTDPGHATIDSMLWTVHVG